MFLNDEQKQTTVMTYQATAPSRVPYDVDDGQNRTVMMVKMTWFLPIMLTGRIGQ